MADDDAQRIVPRYAPRLKPMAIPSPLVFDAPLVCVQLNERWVGHLLGVMEALDQPDAWLGTPEEIQAARDQINQLMLIFSTGNCAPETGGGIIYDPIDDTFYWYPPGGGAPIEVPQVDPRNIPIVPPKTTGDIRCDSAASLVAWFQTHIDEITFAWGEGATVLGAASLLIAALTGGFIALIILAIDIMGVIFGFGLSVVQGAFTAEVYAQLLCIFFARMDENGQFDDASKAAMLDDIYNQIGGTAFGVLSGMMQLMGVAGLNNQAAAGLETDDCSECAESCDYFDDMETELGEKTYIGDGTNSGAGAFGVWTDGMGRTGGGAVIGVAHLPDNLRLAIVIVDLGQDCNITYLSAWLYRSNSGGTASFYCQVVDDANTTVFTQTVVNVDWGWVHYENSVLSVTGRYIMFAYDTNVSPDMRIDDLIIGAEM